MAHGNRFTPLVTIVGFHHARGPEVEAWFGAEDGHDPAADNEWPLLPFMALSDGAHATTEDFAYFTLRHEATETEPAKSVFGISCTRQMDANELIHRPADVTRSTVQKAVVVIADSPQAFGQVREKLAMVTNAWFTQRDFTDLDIIKVKESCYRMRCESKRLTVKQKFQESLVKTIRDSEDERDQYLGLSLRELIHEFKHQTLVLFKCCLLQPKMLFFGSRCERLCMMQFSLISLIPGLIRNLQDCADPELDSYQNTLIRPTSLKTSERGSLLSYMGLPLQLFGKGSLFGPYTPLQQLDVLADHDTRSYIVGSTNSLLLQQKDRYSDILINLDEVTIEITSPSLRAALSLSVADRRWIDFLTQTVQDTWDESNPGRPKTMGYMGSEEFIRLQFEEYLLSLISSVKYHIYLQAGANDAKSLLSDVGKNSSSHPGLLALPLTLSMQEGDPSSDFGPDWVEAWMTTENFAIFQKFTGPADSHLFDIVEPHHPCAGGLTVEDIQRRLAQQVSELHLDERFNTGREVLSKHLATGQKKVTSAFNNLWADIEVMREAQRKRNEERQAAAGTGSGSSPPLSPQSTSEKKFPRAPDLTAATANISAASTRATTYLSNTRAGAYFSNWRSGWGNAAGSAQGSASATDKPAGRRSGHVKRRSKGTITDSERDAAGLIPLDAGKRDSVGRLRSLELGRKIAAESKTVVEEATGPPPSSSSVMPPVGAETKTTLPKSTLEGVNTAEEQTLPPPRAPIDTAPIDTVPTKGTAPTPTEGTAPAPTDGTAPAPAEAWEEAVFPSAKPKSKPSNLASDSTTSNTTEEAKALTQ
ncbi:MAG: hypothetical protein M1825_005603 [Sarcosagium campestre]|nr:MAG: hypothetical protein M1825_005603 [Sarcosagium campestre]